MAFEKLKLYIISNNLTKFEKSIFLKKLLQLAFSRKWFSVLHFYSLTKVTQCENWATWSVWPEKNRTNVYKSCPKMISLEKLKILTPLQNLPKNVGDLGKLIIVKGFEKLPKVL